VKKFRFRLEALLKLREHTEREKQKELAGAVKQVVAQTRTLHEIADRNRDTIDGKRERLGGTVSVAEMQLYSRYQHRLKRDTIGATEFLRVLKKTEAEKRQDLLEATRRKKIYEKLKERRSRQHYREIEHESTQEADEVGLNSYRARQRATS